jgi:hypothetical protein
MPSEWSIWFRVRIGPKWFGMKPKLRGRCLVDEVAKCMRAVRADLYIGKSET